MQESSTNHQENYQPSSALFCAMGSEDTFLTDEEILSQLQSFLKAMGPREEVLIVPPDYTRFHSQAGKITRWICELYHFIPKEDQHEDHDDIVTLQTSSNNNSAISTPQKIEILPALGTHHPMTYTQITNMFGNALARKSPSPFLVHDWRNDVVTIGHVPSSMVKEATYGLLEQEWPAQLNHHVWSKRFDKYCNKKSPLVISIGQVVPHEVMGMANYNKNLFVGVGGVEAINLSHFIGAVHGMENMMGQSQNPLRSILNYASEMYLENQIDVWYILTVIGRNSNTHELGIQGFYIGRNIECYNLACELSLKVNFIQLEYPPTKMIVYLDPDEFHSTWLGNKVRFIYIFLYSKDDMPFIE